MRGFFLYITIFISFYASSQKTTPFFSFGLDYRQYPIDIEDVPRGPLPGYNGLPSDDYRFWKVISIHSRYGLRLEKNWLLSASFYGRYNLLHRLEGVNYFSPDPTVLEPSPKKVKERKNLKFDFFIDVEKKIKLKKNKEIYLFALAGIGFTNINSRFDIILTDSVESIPFESHHYKGTLLHFGPRISLGYQYKKIKASLDAYMIEGADLANLTALWTGATISYEMLLKKKKKKQ
jgi:hypothetical protein